MIADFDIGPVDELCEKYKVHRLYLFGSALTDKFNARAEIDDAYKKALTEVK